MAPGVTEAIVQCYPVLVLGRLELSVEDAGQAAARADLPRVRASNLKERWKHFPRSMGKHEIVIVAPL